MSSESASTGNGLNIGGSSIPQNADVRTGVDFTLTTARDAFSAGRYDAQLWGYDNSEDLISEIAQVFSPMAAQRLSTGESTQNVRNFLLEKISTRLRAVQTTVQLISAAVAAIKNKTDGITEVVVLAGRPGVVINGVGDAEIGQTCKGLRDMINRVLRHGDTMKHTDIFFTVLSSLKQQST